MWVLAACFQLKISEYQESLAVSTKDKDGVESNQNLIILPGAVNL
jgi:hypothetical protein